MAMKECSELGRGASIERRFEGGWSGGRSIDWRGAPRVGGGAFMGCLGGGGPRSEGGGGGAECTGGYASYRSSSSGSSVGD